MRRRIATAIATLCSLALVVPAAGCGGGGSVTNLVATGSVTCSTLTGVASFSPPLTLTGSAPETTTISLNAGGCTVSNSNAGGVSGGRATVTNNTATSNCTSLLTSRPVKVAVEWTPTTLHPSAVSFSGYAPSKSSAGAGSGFVFPDPGGKASATGSFAGDDGGKSTTVSAFTTEGESQLLGACGSPAGLTSIAISSGTFKVG